MYNFGYYVYLILYNFYKLLWILILVCIRVNYVGYLEEMLGRYRMFYEVNEKVGYF